MFLTLLYTKIQTESGLANTALAKWTASKTYFDFCAMNVRCSATPPSV